VKIRGAVLIAAAAVIIAFAWPAGADRVVYVLLAIIVASLTVPPLRAFAARYPTVSEWPRRRAFSERPEPPKPHQLATLERSIKASIGPHDDALTVPLREQLRAHASRRLLDHHRLDADDPKDQAAIQAMVSPTLWLIVEPPRRDGFGRSVPTAKVPAVWLDRLVSEVESL
jgi:hypothetical protein